VEKQLEGSIGSAGHHPPWHTWMQPLFALTQCKAGKGKGGRINGFKIIYVGAFR